MGAITSRYLATFLLSILSLSFLLNAGCITERTISTEPAPVETLYIQVSLLVHVNENDVRWFRDVEVPHGTNGYELTEIVTEGNLESTYYPAFFSHFVESLFGIANQNPHFWLTYLWNEGQQQWEPLPVGADLFSLKNGHFLAWSYTDNSQQPSRPHSVTP